MPINLLKVERVFPYRSRQVDYLNRSISPEGEEANTYDPPAGEADKKTRANVRWGGYAQVRTWTSIKRVNG